VSRSPDNGSVRSATRALRLRRATLVAGLFLLGVLQWPYWMSLIDRFSGDRFDDFALVYRSAQVLLRGDSVRTVVKSTLELNLNPPHFHLIVLPLTAFDLNGATLTWAVLMMASLLVALALIHATLGREMTLDHWLVMALLLMVFPGPYAVLVSGAFSFGLLLLMTLAWRALRTERWTRAGVFLGFALSLKLFLGLMIVYLAYRRQWRAVLAAALTTTAVVAAGIVVFGTGAYREWGRTLQDVAWEAGLLNGSIRGMLARMALLHPTGLGPAAARVLWLLAASLVLVVTATSIRRRRGCVDQHLVLLLAAALLVSPLGWTHYLVLALGPCAAIASGGRSPFPSIGAWLIVAGFTSLALPFPLLVYAWAHQWGGLTVASASFWGLLAVWLAFCLCRDSHVGGPALWTTSAQ
jgi:hypothetical protein